MALPSQSARGGTRGGSSVVYRRNNRPRIVGFVVLLVAVGVVGLGGWFVWGWIAGGPSDEEQVAEVDPAVDGMVPVEDPAETVASRPGRTTPPVRERETVLATPSDDPVNDTAASGTARDRLAGEPSRGDEGGVLSEALNRPAEPERTRPDPVRTLTLLERALEKADELVAQNDPVAARYLLSDTLKEPSLDESDRSTLRLWLTQLNDELVFGPTVDPDDPMTESYRVQSGDRLSKIATQRELATHWKLIQRVNGLADPNKIRLGQALKLVRGPFHAVVSKSAFRLDVYHGPPANQDAWVYVASFPIGLGEDDGTPIGTFTVRRGSKLENPAWVNPRDSTERYTRDDPMNPIGEYWIGLEGLGDAAAYEGYGIHGTIDLDSIGRQRSLGCVRMLPDDVALMYELLAEGISVVRIDR